MKAFSDVKRRLSPSRAKLEEEKMEQGEGGLPSGSVTARSDAAPPSILSTSSQSQPSSLDIVDDKSLLPDFNIGGGRWVILMVMGLDNNNNLLLISAKSRPFQQVSNQNLLASQTVSNHKTFR